MVALVPPSCAPGHSQYPGAQCSQVCGGNLLRTGLLCTPDNPCVTTTSWLNKTEITPLIVLKRKREMALILQNSDLDVQKKRSQWSEWWWWGIQRVCLGLRVSGFGSYHFVLKMNKRCLFCVAVSTLVPSAQDSTASPCRVGGGLGGPFSLAVPHVPVAVAQTHP